VRLSDQGTFSGLPIPDQPILKEVTKFERILLSSSCRLMISALSASSSSCRLMISALSASYFSDSVDLLNFNFSVLSALAVLVVACFLSFFLTTDSDSVGGDSRGGAGRPFFFHRRVRSSEFLSRSSFWRAFLLCRRFSFSKLSCGASTGVLGGRPRFLCSAGGFE